ncbi:MAG: Ldh family oxidoreductase [Candidatus Bathyarchaeota archaeon]|nr:Ldh family oxidoreductase [Candidatus Bathyarchaeota archaeon]MDW8040360.1 Ldh family oxidoreductase [Nitrososphaerota archaeon]
MEMKTISAEQLKHVCVEILKSVGANNEEADIVADSLVKANLRGVDSHGVIRLEVYVNRVKYKTIIPGAPIKIVRETSSTALVDGSHGFGQVIAVKAMKIAIEKAKKTGVGAVGVFNTNHFGMLAYYALIALQEDMISLITTNGSPFVVPWGGRVPMLGTNPICIGIPSNQEIPIILDMATSAAARGKIEKAAKEGAKIPADWAVDEEGKPTTDPVAALKGALLPFGGPKGYGLSFIIDILSGCLTGAAFGQHVISLYPEDKNGTLGHFILAINPETFIGVKEFKTAVAKAVQEIKACPTAPNVPEVLVPGEIEYRTEQKRLKEGIPMGSETWRIIEKLCKETGVKI